MGYIDELFQEWMKSGNDDIPDKLANVIQQGSDRYIIPGIRFLESYESRTPCFHLHIAVKRDVKILGKLDGGEWCFVVSHSNARIGLQDASVWQNNAAMWVGKIGGGNMQQTMLVSIGQASKNRKGMSRRIIPSCVRLQKINDCQYVRSNTAGNIRLQWLSRVTSGTNIENRELSRSGYRPTVLFDQTASEMVECRSEIMDAISKDNPDALIRLTNNVKLKKNQFLVAWLDIANDFVWLTVKVARDFTIYSQQVLLCPIELEKDTAGYRHTLYSKYEERQGLQHL